MNVKRILAILISTLLLLVQPGMLLNLDAGPHPAPADNCGCALHGCCATPAQGNTTPEPAVPAGQSSIHKIQSPATAPSTASLPPSVDDAMSSVSRAFVFRPLIAVRLHAMHCVFLI